MVPSNHDLSVVMPVRNALPHLDDAIRSILEQTYRDFEFVIYDDASTDGSTQRLRDWAQKDGRIRLIEGATNLGPVGSSNRVVEASTGSLIARMDADDWSHPQRLELQLRALEADASAGLVGTFFDIIDRCGQQIRPHDRWRLGGSSPFIPFAHGSIMYRRTIFNRLGGYRSECDYWEDQDFIFRVAAIADVLVIPQSLFRFRQWERPRPGKANETRIENAIDLMYRCVARSERGKDYDDLLAESRHRQPARVDPRVFISLGSRLLWCGGRPMLFGRLLRRGRFSLNLRTAMALVWTAWAAANPSSLRVFLRFLLGVRNARAREAAESDEPLRWVPPRLKQSSHSIGEPAGSTLDLVHHANSR